MGEAHTSSMLVGEWCPRKPMANNVQGDRAIDPTRRLQRKLYRAVKQSRDRRFHALYDKVHRTDILWRAWQEVARNRGAAGVDEVSIEAIKDQGVETILNELREELVSGHYRPLPVRRVTIPKRAGGERHLGVPAIRDRIRQLTPLAKIGCPAIVVVQDINRFLRGWGAKSWLLQVSNHLHCRTPRKLSHQRCKVTRLTNHLARVIATLGCVAISSGRTLRGFFNDIYIFGCR
jgi:hypothetical protein